MPFTPSPADVQVEDEVLSNIAIARIMDPAQRSWVAKAAPLVPVDLQSGAYPVWNAGDMNRDTVREIGPGEEYPIFTVGLSKDDYTCKVRKDSVMIPDELRANAVASVRLDQAMTKTLSNKFLIRSERAFASSYVTTSVWTGSSTGGDITPSNGWNDESSGTPRDDLDTQIDALDTKGFPMEELKLFVGLQGFNALRKHPQFADIFEGNAQAEPYVEPRRLAGAMGISEVVVCRGNYNSAAKGQADSFARTFPDDVALLLHCQPNPGLEVPSAAYTFVWANYSGSNDYGVQVEPYRRGERDSDQLKGRTAWDQKQVSALGGVFFNNIIQ